MEEIQLAANLKRDLFFQASAEHLRLRGLFEGHNILQSEKYNGRIQQLSRLESLRLLTYIHAFYIHFLTLSSLCLKTQGKTPILLAEQEF